MTEVSWLVKDEQLSNQEELLKKQISIWFQEATAHHQKQQYEQAAALYRKIIQNAPNHADSLHLLGLIEGERGNLEKAIDCISRAIQHRPNFAAYNFNRGLLYRRQQQLDLAVADFRRAILCQPDFLPAWLQLGEAFTQRMAYREAILFFQQARGISYTSIDVLHGLGVAYLADEQYEKALACFLDIQQQAAHIEALVNQGVALLGLKREQEAISLYEKALADHPKHLQLLTNLALAYAQAEFWDKAESTNKQIIALYPADAQAHSHLGVIYKEQGQHEAALAEFEQALRLDANKAEIQFNAAITYLLLGDWQKGWKYYGSRLMLKEAQRLFEALPPFTASRWQGESLQGKTLFVMAEQGIGDTLQFIRYLPLLKAQGATIILECQGEVKSFLQEQPALGITHLIARGEKRPAYDYFIPLLSLAGMLKTFSADAIPSKQSYLLASKAWCALPPTDKSLKVGIVWAGNPQHRNDKKRSIALSHWQSLWGCSAIAFYSLQHGARSQDLEANNLQTKIIDLSLQLKDFKATASLLMQLDLLITVDTSLAHLSAALGRPTWLLLPFVPDFRWGLKEETSAWYESMRLFRQPTKGDWGSVFERIHKGLKNDKQ